MVTKACVQEAKGKAHTAWATPGIPAAVQAILDDPAADVTAESSSFWVLVAALKRFVVCLPAECTEL